MRTHDTFTTNAVHLVITRSPSPELAQLSSPELHELLIQAGKQFELISRNEAEINELIQLQVQIAAIKDELHRKANLTPESSFGANYFSKSLPDLS